MFPFMINSPIIEYPLSGNVTQDISPHFRKDIKGVPEIEHEVITGVASYGKQLGKLTEAVLALAALHEDDPDKHPQELKKLAELARDVEGAKAKALEAVKARVKTAMDDWERLDPDGYTGRRPE